MASGFPFLERASSTACVCDGCIYYDPGEYYNEPIFITAGAGTLVVRGVN